MRIVIISIGQPPILPTGSDRHCPRYKMLVLHCIVLKTMRGL